MKFVLLAVLAVGCGRIGFSSCPDDATCVTKPGVQVHIAPSPLTILPGTQMQLVATTSGAQDNRVTWSVAQGGGTITADGVYAAAAIGDVRLVAASVEDPSATAERILRVTSALVPAEIVSVGAVTAPTGMSHQTRLLYAPELGEWWLWFTSAGDLNHLQSRTSKDFVTWVDGPDLTLARPHGNDGRNFNLADRVIGGEHVVHMSVGFIDSARGRFHVKARLTGGTCAYGAPQLINVGGNVEPDGPAVAITQSGFVIDATGWEGTPQTPPLQPCGDGDAEIYTSQQPDTGLTDFDTMGYRKEVVWCVPTRIDARYLLADGETIYQLYDDGTSDPNPINLLFNIRRSDGTWLPIETTFTKPPRVFKTDVSFDLDDWTARPLDRTLHAIRRADSLGFEHREFALGTEGAWTDGAPIPAAATIIAGSGVFLSTYGTGLIAVHLTSDNGLEYTFWDRTSWSAWMPLDLPAGVTRRFIAGSTPAGSDRAAIIWTEMGLSTHITGAPLP